MRACTFARENKKPFLGICLGMQVAVIEYCRNMLGWKDANSEEFDKNTTKPVVIFMPEGSKTVMGGTMRLGDLPPTAANTPPPPLPPLPQA